MSARLAMCMTMYTSLGPTPDCSRIVTHRRRLHRCRRKRRRGVHGNLAGTGTEAESRTIIIVWSPFARRRREATLNMVSVVHTAIGQFAVVRVFAGDEVQPGWRSLICGTGTGLGVACRRTGTGE